MQRGNRRSGVGILHRRNQRGIGQDHGGAVAMAPAPPVGETLHVEIDSGTLDTRTRGGECIEQTGRRGRLPHDGRTAGTCDAGLFAADAVTIVTEPVGVIQIDRGDHRDIGIDDVDRIQPAAQTDLQHRHIQRGPAEQVQRRKGAEFEIGQRYLTASGLDPLERGHQGGIIRVLPENPHALVVIDQVRRGERAGTLPGGAQHRLEQRDGGALAIGAADRDQPPRRRRCTHPAPDLAHAIQTQLDAADVDAFLIGEPFGESACHEADHAGKRAEA